MAKQPNILVLWGDDIGTWNLSYFSRGMMGYRTPNMGRAFFERLWWHDQVVFDASGRLSRLVTGQV